MGGVVSDTEKKENGQCKPEDIFPKGRKRSECAERAVGKPGRKGCNYETR
jgi:hypothetical protein